MATIEEALNASVLHEFVMPEHEGRVPLRRLILADELFDWIDETDALDDTHWGRKWGGRTRREHLEQTFCDFRCEARPLVGELRRLMPHGKGLWKMHSNGLRTFGWVPAPHEFVGICCDFSENTHGRNSTVGANMSYVIEFARRHRLEGTMMRGDHIALFPQEAG